MSSIISNSTFPDAVAHRRTVYGLKSTLPDGVTDSTIEDLIKGTLPFLPSAFNSQTARLVLLVGAEHRKFWQGAAGVLQGKQDEETFKRTKSRLDGFEGAHGSVRI